jgi:hypothetical protein
MRLTSTGHRPRWPHDISAAGFWVRRRSGSALPASPQNPAPATNVTRQKSTYPPRGTVQTTGASSQFFLLRWLWRLVIWTLFLWDVSRLRLNLMATHADKAAGLGFLGVAHVLLSIFPFAMGCVFAAEIAFRMRFEGLDVAALRGMTPLLAAYLVFVEVMTFGPLLLLVPVLARVRREGLRSYGMLVQRHNQLFHDKWIEGAGQDNELPLGDSDMSSLIDLGDSLPLSDR